jgi:hypothetical protein
MNGEHKVKGIVTSEVFPFLTTESKVTKKNVIKLQIKAGTNKEYAFFFNHIRHGLSLLSKKPLKKKKKGTAIIG